MKSVKRIVSKDHSEKVSFSRFQIVLMVVVALLVGFAIYKSTTSDSQSSSYGKSDTQTYDHTKNDSGSPTPPTVYLSPSTHNYQSGSTFKVAVLENSGTTPVNAVQANISYPADKLSLVSQDYSSSAFPVDAQSKGGNGSIAIARGRIGRLTGNQEIATLTFKVDAKDGVAKLQFTEGTSLVSADANKSILTSLNSTAGASFTIQ